MAVLRDFGSAIGRVVCHQASSDGSLNGSQLKQNNTAVPWSRRFLFSMFGVSFS
jgi:hypothetical protein